MRNAPEKIIKKTNESEIDQMSRTKKKHIPLAPLFNFLKERRAWGPSGSTTSSVADIMYEYEPPVDQITTTLPDEKKISRKRNSYGEGRLENLKRGYRATSGERKWFRWALGNAMNNQWYEEIDENQLVELPLDEIFQIGLASGLPWPENLECYYALKSMALKNKTAFSISIRTWPYKLGSNPLGNREGLKPERKVSVLPVGYEYLIDLKNISNPIEKQVLIFEASEVRLKLKGANEPKELFLSRLLDPNQNNIEVCCLDPDTQSKGPFEILDNIGRFSYYALSVPRAWNLEEIFDVGLDETEWNTETSQRFLKNLNLILHKYPAVAQIAHWDYQVD